MLMSLGLVGFCSSAYCESDITVVRDGKAAAAIVLARLGVRAGEPHYRDLAVRTLASQTPVYRQHGLDGAAYVVALDQIQTAVGT